ncbi:MAG: glucosaminidase domain-containing protein [Treponema sp.]|jgi:hypothetical protein|nr:glucosaminidase domain-containing protein [Treponema sp.]
MKTISSLILAFLIILMPISCATIQPEKPEIPEISNVVLKKPAPPIYIMSAGMISAENLAFFLLQNNPRVDAGYARMLAIIYTEEAAFEGVNHDIAFVQMTLETGFLSFRGDVKPEQNNFAGLGAIGNGEPGLSFPNARIGVRAQIQHLKAYGCVEPLNGELVNPRFRFVRRGVAPTYEGLAGTWAADRLYADKIRTILQRLYDFSFAD